jgi:pentalenene oxygenase
MDRRGNEAPWLRGRHIQEAMRLYLPAWTFPRFADQEAVVGGHRIPVGSTLLLSPFVTHRRS